jgi:hypothetical protein
MILNFPNCILIKSYYTILAGYIKTSNVVTQNITEFFNFIDKSDNNGK